MTLRLNSWHTMAEPGSWRDTLGGILFFFLWPLYIPYLVLKSVIFRPLEEPYVRTVGWLKMKLGLWQPIGYYPAYSEARYDYTPGWVKKAFSEKLRNREPGDYTFILNGRSFKYRVKVRLRGQKVYTVRTYRKLRTPLHSRVLSKLNAFR